MDMPNYALAKHLADDGRTVHLVAHSVAEELSLDPNIIVHHATKPLGSYLLGEPVLNRIGRFWAARVRAQGGHVVVNGGNCEWPDTNWVHYVHAAHHPQQAGSVARRLKIRVGHQLALSSERRALRQARLLIANSERTKEDIVEGLGVPPERVRTIYYGIDPERFRPATASERHAVRSEMRWPEDRLVLAFVGALGNRRKGFDTLFDAWQLLCSDASWDVQLVVMGTGVELPSWIARAQEARMQSRISFLGFRSDVPRLIAACDALVAPTRYEAYGLAVQEALCCGIPALTTQTAGIAERYPRELSDLLLPDPDNAADLARRLRMWRASVQQARSSVAAFGERLRAYRWSDMAADLVRAIESGA